MYIPVPDGNHTGACLDSSGSRRSDRPPLIPDPANYPIRILLSRRDIANRQTGPHTRRYITLRH